MKDSEIREMAEKHYEYSEKLLKAAGIIPTKLHHYLYVEAMIHGYKHGKRDKRRRR